MIFFVSFEVHSYVFCAVVPQAFSTDFRDALKALRSKAEDPSSLTTSRLTLKRSKPRDERRHFQDPAQLRRELNSCGATSRLDRIQKISGVALTSAKDCRD